MFHSRNKSRLHHPVRITIRWLVWLCNQGRYKVSYLYNLRDKPVTVKEAVKIIVTVTQCSFLFPLDFFLVWWVNNSIMLLLPWYLTNFLWFITNTGTYAYGKTLKILSYTLRSSFSSYTKKLEKMILSE